MDEQRQRPGERADRRQSSRFYAYAESLADAYTYCVAFSLSIAYTLAHAIPNAHRDAKCYPFPLANSYAEPNTKSNTDLLPNAFTIPIAKPDSDVVGDPISYPDRFTYKFAVTNTNRNPDANRGSDPDADRGDWRAGGNRVCFLHYFGCPSGCSHPIVRPMQ